MSELSPTEAKELLDSAEIVTRAAFIELSTGREVFLFVTDKQTRVAVSCDYMVDVIAQSVEYLQGLGRKLQLENGDFLEVKRLRETPLFHVAKTKAN